MHATATKPAIDFYPASDGRRLALRVWRPDTTANARVVFLHGITSHGGWYGQVAQHLADAGFEVHFLDRRGSGLNAEQPGDVDHWYTWIDDVAVYLRTQRERLPTVLAGISWGGKLAPAVARRHAALVDAVALICPGIYSPYLPGIAKRLLLAGPTPRWLQRRHVPIPLRNAELFTASRRWRQFIAEDPLALRRVTWRFAQQDRCLTRFARESAPFLQVPVLMMLAGQDQIVNNRRTRAFFVRIGGKRKTLIEYPAAGHTLEFERSPEPYFSDLATWVRSVSE